MSDSKNSNPDEGLSFPFLELCGITRTFMKDGHCTAEVEPRSEILNSLGIAHGGLLVTLADAAMGGACRSLLPETSTIVTINMQTSFLSPGIGKLEAKGSIVRKTKSLMFAECEVQNSTGKSVARTTGVFQILDRDRFGSA